MCLFERENEKSQINNVELDDLHLQFK